MSAFTRHTAPRACEPRHVITLPPSAFADSWRGKPHAPERIGIRTVSELELTVAQSEAVKKAIEAHEDNEPREFRVEAFNDYLITNTLARACVKAHDVTQAYFAPGPEDLIREALTPGGIRRIWDEYCRFAVVDSPVSPSATDDELLLLAEQCVSLLDGVEPARAERARKLGAAMLLELKGVALE